jgi:hypothetical protein
MPFTEDETGLLNNFAIEPKVYEAELPSEQQKKQYKIIGAISAILLLGLIVVAVTVS